jgi:hypothetical protein
MVNPRFGKKGYRELSIYVGETLNGSSPVSAQSNSSLR